MRRGDLRVMLAAVLSVSYQVSDVELSMDALSQ